MLLVCHILAGVNFLGEGLSDRWCHAWCARIVKFDFRRVVQFSGWSNIPDLPLLETTFSSWPDVVLSALSADSNSSKWIMAHLCRWQSAHLG